MAKRSRAQIAAAGTKRDPTACAGAGRSTPECASGAAMSAGKGREPWYLPALDSAALSARERLTRRIFTTAQVVLCLVFVVSVGAAAAASDGMSAEALRSLFTGDPAMAITLVAACLQAFIAYLVGFSYKHYAKGDAGYAAGNLVVLLCAEILMRSPVGIAAMAVSLWRVWQCGSQRLSGWMSGRGVTGVLVDLSGSIIVLALAAVCLYASLQLW